MKVKMKTQTKKMTKTKKMKTNRYWLSLFKINPCKIQLNRLESCIENTGNYIQTNIFPHL